MGKKRCIIWAAALLIALLAVLAGWVMYQNRSTKIPTLYFEGDISNMEKKTDVRDIRVRYEDGEKGFSAYASLKVQGTSSLAYEKKNYTIKFYRDADHEEKLSVDVGWGEQNVYCLKANWIDRTHARNVVTAKLVAQVQQKYGVLTQAPCNGAVDGFPVEIYSNGRFLGLYTFNIPKDEWQFGMDSDNSDHIVICGENWEPTNLFFEEPDFDNWSVEVGEENDETLDKMKTVFDFVINSTDEEFRADFDKHLNLDAALNYYVLADAAYLKDNLGKNMLMATYDGKVWYLSLYDLDTSWGTNDSGRALLEYETQGLDFSKSNLFVRMEECFGAELAQRYFDLRQDILTKEHIMAEFEAFREKIPAWTLLKEANRWGTGIRKTTEDLPGYDYDQIESYLDTVLERLDAKYTAMLDQ
ncbi:MAG: CotH kinase family protein [Faecousia sp.]